MGEQVTKTTALDRLIEWHDYGTGPSSYTAGSREFGDDVAELLQLQQEMRRALIQCRGELLRNLQREGDPTQRAWLKNAHDAANDAIAKAEGRS